MDEETLDVQVMIESSVEKDPCVVLRRHLIMGRKLFEIGDDGFFWAFDCFKNRALIMLKGAEMDKLIHVTSHGRYLAGNTPVNEAFCFY
jgi:hypothetical protein